MYPVREALGELGILDFDQRAARLFARITAYLQEIGRPAGDMDVLIGATSMAAGHCLITRNASHFENIPELAIETITPEDRRCHPLARKQTRGRNLVP